LLKKGVRTPIRTTTGRGRDSLSFGKHKVFRKNDGFWVGKGKNGVRPGEGAKKKKDRKVCVREKGGEREKKKPRWKNREIGQVRTPIKKCLPRARPAESTGDQQGKKKALGGRQGRPESLQRG